jgi:hypothetical protein
VNDTQSFPSKSDQKEGTAYPLLILFTLLVLPLATGGILSALGLFAQSLPLVLGLITLGGLLAILSFAARKSLIHYRALTPKAKVALHRLLLRRGLLFIALLTGGLAIALMSVRAFLSGGIFLVLALLGGVLRKRLA